MALDVALVDCRHLDHDDGDRGPLLEALGARGLRAGWWAWDDPAIDWSTARLVVIRMTWDYTDRVTEFLDWVDQAEAGSTVVLNPPRVVRWNAHKSYLLDLAAAGVPTVPTEVVREGGWGGVDAVAGDRGWTEVVVKPTVGVGANGAFRAPVGSLAATVPPPDHDVLVQPFMASIGTEGETSAILFEGDLSHAVRKVPQVGDYRVQLQYGGRERAVDPTDAQLAVAQAALDVVGEPLLYARVDLVDGPDGAPLVMELEVIEPSLFLGFATGAAERFAAAIEARLLEIA
jgi:glutathione synthase/RimK-type ligase-like ATP-grasp enzyme